MSVIYFQKSRGLESVDLTVYNTITIWKVWGVAIPIYRARKCAPG